MNSSHITTPSPTEDAAATKASGENQRRHFRVDCKIPVHVRDVASGRAGSAMVANLGLGGARVDFPDSVAPNTSITLFLPTGDGHSQDLVLEGRVVWAFSEAAEDSPLHPAGLQFVHLDASARRRLFDLVERLRAPSV